MGDVAADRAAARTTDVSAELLTALERAAERFARLAGNVEDAGGPVRRSTWTTGDLVAHVTGGLEAYARYLDGDEAAVVDVSDVAGGSLTTSNTERLTEEPERTISVLLDRGALALAQVVEATAGRSLDEPVPWHGRREPLRCLLATALCEQLLHGRDLAASIHAPWPISKREAVLVIDNIAPLLPILVNPQTTRTLVASMRIVIRDGPTINLTFDKGNLSVGGHPDRFDATVHADPLAFLLVAYGRTSQWTQIARGRLIAWGRRPWLALRLTTYLVAP
jgi:uncharacterized protein (TIGR03083 family)